MSQDFNGQLSIFDLPQSKPDYHGALDEITRYSIEVDFENMIKLRKCCGETPKNILKAVMIILLNARYAVRGQNIIEKPIRLNRHGTEKRLNEGNYADGKRTLSLKLERDSFKDQRKCRLEV